MKAKTTCSIGEIIDKITILIIKMNKISCQKKIKNINNELSSLVGEIKYNFFDDENFKNLLIVNTELWNIEDEIRAKEKLQEFDLEFISIARCVYILNDRRCLIKTKINDTTQSMLREEKSYTDLNYDQFFIEDNELNKITKSYLEKVHIQAYNNFKNYLSIIEKLRK